MSCICNSLITDSCQTNVNDIERLIGYCKSIGVTDKALIKDIEENRVESIDMEQHCTGGRILTVKYKDKTIELDD